MTTEVLSFHPDDNVGDAMTGLVDRGIDAAPVIDADGLVVGVISTGDLIVQETELHVPTIVSLFGATIELPKSRRHFEEDLRRALGGHVSDVMSTKPFTITSSETVEDAATIMHDENVSRLPVVEDGRLVGIISRTDILRSIIRDDRSAEG